MKPIVVFALALCALLCLSPVAHAMQSELVQITAEDGYLLTGKLSLPDDTPAKRLVIFVNGSGPNTYDNHRTFGETSLNYFDLFAESLTQAGVAFFRYSTRGVTPGEDAPYYAEIDDAGYATYLPLNSVSDVACMIRTLQKDARLLDAEVYLLGWSEGTVIAPLVVKNTDARVDALVLAGYVNESMDKVLAWQQSGASSIMFYQDYFDTDADGAVSRAEYEADPNGIVPSLGVGFDALDLDKDEQLTAHDFYLYLTDDRARVFAAFEDGDDQWLRENYPVRLTSAWYRQHCSLPPNSEVLPTLDLPIHIFHGTRDANVSVQGVRDIEQTFEKLGKANLTTHIYEGADHNLGYLRYVYTGVCPQAFVDLFAVCGAGLCA